MEIPTELLHADSSLVETIVDWHLHEWGAQEGGERETWTTRLRSRTHHDDIPFTVVGFLDDELVGSLTVSHDDVDSRFAEAGPWLAGMLVIGKARNLGIGRALLTHAAEQAKRCGATTLWLYTTEASQFYERCGYQVAHRKESAMDTAVLWRDL